MHRGTVKVALLAGMACCLLLSGTAQAGNSEVDMLQQKLAEMQARLATLEEQNAEEARRAEIREVLEEMDADAAARGGLPGWMDNLEFYGDLRLRYEGWCIDEDVPEGSNRRTKDRNRFRFRLRFGIKKHFLNEQLEVGFRLASGSSSNPTSTNQTFTGGFSEKQIWIDRAYAKYTPDCVPGLMVIGGKYGWPWHTSKFFWDSDINVEGFYAEYSPEIHDMVEPFGGLGYFVVNESRTGDDVDMLSYSAGARVKYNGIKGHFAANLWNWNDYRVAFPGAALTVPAGVATVSNNNVYLGDADDFTVINLDASVGATVSNIPVKAFFSWAHNCDSNFDIDADGDGDPDEDRDNAYAMGVTVGQAKKQGDWAATLAYGWIEANALPGAFVDSDFSAFTGGTNVKGWKAGGKYMLTDFLTLAVTYFNTQPIDGDLVQINDYDGDLDDEFDEGHLVQVDLVFEF